MTKRARLYEGPLGRTRSRWLGPKGRRTHRASYGSGAISRATRRPQRATRRTHAARGTRSRVVCVGTIWHDVKHADERVRPQRDTDTPRGWNRDRRRDTSGESGAVSMRTLDACLMGCDHHTSPLEPWQPRWISPDLSAYRTTGARRDGPSPRLPLPSGVRPAQA